MTNVRARNLLEIVDCVSLMRSGTLKLDRGSDGVLLLLHDIDESSHLWWKEALRLTQELSQLWRTRHSQPEAGNLMQQGEIDRILTNLEGVVFEQISELGSVGEDAQQQVRPMSRYDARQWKRMLDCVSAMRQGLVGPTAGSGTLMFLVSALEDEFLPWSSFIQGCAGELELIGLDTSEMGTATLAERKELLNDTLDDLERLIQHCLAKGHVPEEDDLD